MSECQSKRLQNLLDLVKAVVEPPRFELGPSSGDDGYGSPLGPSIGDDNYDRQSKTLGACVGDDESTIPANTVSTTALGACVGDDSETASVGPSVGDDAAQG